MFGCWDVAIFAVCRRRCRYSNDNTQHEKIWRPSLTNSPVSATAATAVAVINTCTQNSFSPSSLRLRLSSPSPSPNNNFNSTHTHSLFQTITVCLFRRLSLSLSPSLRRARSLPPFIVLASFLTVSMRFLRFSSRHSMYQQRKKNCFFFFWLLLFFPFCSASTRSRYYRSIFKFCERKTIQRKRKREELIENQTVSSLVVAHSVHLFIYISLLLWYFSISNESNVSASLVHWAYVADCESFAYRFSFVLAFDYKKTAIASRISNSANESTGRQVVLISGMCQQIHRINCSHNKQTQQSNNEMKFKLKQAPLTHTTHGVFDSISFRIVHIKMPTILLTTRFRRFIGEKNRNQNYNQSTVTHSLTLYPATQLFYRTIFTSRRLIYKFIFCFAPSPSLPRFISHEHTPANKVVNWNTVGFLVAGWYVNQHFLP